MLFSTSSMLTMLHGLVLSGGALILLVLALLSLRLIGTGAGAAPRDARNSAMIGRLCVAASVLLWLSVISGTYVIFPMYRETPPEGIAVLADYPRALLLSRPDTRWLHSFGMEIKEHVPWIAAILATAAAFVARRQPGLLTTQGVVRRATGALLFVALILTASVALLGVFINKVAPVW
jgi:hypothetical protein